MYLLTFAPNEDSNQPAHPRSLIRVFVVHMKKHCILGYSKCTQRRFLLDCSSAQADLNRRWAHRSEGTVSDVETNLLMTNQQLTGRIVLGFYRLCIHTQPTEGDAAFTIRQARIYEIKKKKKKKIFKWN